MDLWTAYIGKGFTRIGTLGLEVKDMSATYKDIQRMTRLSLSTISKYFNGGNLKEKNAVLIADAIEKLDYRVNDLARGLKSKRSRSIGLLIPELTSPFHTSIMSEVSEHLRIHGYSCIVCDCHEDDSREAEWLHFLLDKMVDGIITVPIDKTGAHLQAARDREVPVVLVDRLTTEFQSDAVIIDNFLAGKLAAAELLANGHRNIVMLNGPAGIYTMSLRQKGFSAGLSTIGWEEQNHVYYSGFSIEGGYRTGKRILEAASPPTAIFCSNYEITLGLIMAMNEQDIKINEDVSLIGFDNLMLSNLIKPRITMLVQPIQTIAQQITALMLAQLQSFSLKHSVITLEPKLVRGKSVRDLGLTV